MHVRTKINMQLQQIQMQNTEFQNYIENWHILRTLNSTKLSSSKLKLKFNISEAQRTNLLDLSCVLLTNQEQNSSDKIAYDKLRLSSVHQLPSKCSVTTICRNVIKKHTKLLINVASNFFNQHYYQASILSFHNDSSFLPDNPHHVFRRIEVQPAQL